MMEMPAWLLTKSEITSFNTLPYFMLLLVLYSEHFFTNLKWYNFPISLTHPYYLFIIFPAIMIFHSVTLHWFLIVITALRVRGAWYPWLLIGVSPCDDLFVFSPGEIEGHGTIRSGAQCTIDTAHVGGAVNRGHQISGTMHPAHGRPELISPETMRTNTCHGHGYCFDMTTPAGMEALLQRNSTTGYGNSTVWYGNSTVWYGNSTMWYENYTIRYGVGTA